MLIKSTMISVIKKLLGIKSVNIAELIKHGATIIDVRSKSEFISGHVKNSINIPLDEINSNIENLKSYKHIITCCASGTRSGIAKMTLKSKGIVNVSNGGSWQKVNIFLNQQ